jgi:hypothetical protein
MWVGIHGKNGPKPKIEWQIYANKELERKLEPRDSRLSSSLLVSFPWRANLILKSPPCLTKQFAFYVSPPRGLIGVWSGVSKGVEDGHRPSALQVGHP